MSNKRYEPKDPWLLEAHCDDRFIGDQRPSRDDLEKLISLTRADDVADRDWAVFYLSMVNVDSLNIRAALLEATDDDNTDVVHEAILGLARRSKELALPILKRELKDDWLSLGLTEAAEYIGDPSLAPLLRALIIEGPEAEYLDEWAERAAKMCEEGRAEPSDIDPA